MFVHQNKFCGGDELNLTDDSLARLLEHTIVFFGFNTLFRCHDVNQLYIMYFLSFVQSSSQGSSRVFELTPAKVVSGDERKAAKTDAPKIMTSPVKS